MGNVRYSTHEVLLSDDGFWGVFMFLDPMPMKSCRVNESFVAILAPLEIDDIAEQNRATS